MAPRSKRAGRAVMHLPQVDPVLAALAVWCPTRDASGSETYTAGDVIHVGHDLETLPLREQIGLLGHHILHIALRHEFLLQSYTARAGPSGDADLFVLCADSLINEYLLRGGHAVPRPAVRLAELRAHLGDDAPLSDAALARIDLVEIFHDARKQPQVARAYASQRRFTSDVLPQEAALQSDRSTGQWRSHLIRASQGAGASGRGIGTVFRRVTDFPASQTPWEQRLRGLLVKATTPIPRRSYRRPRARWVAAEADAVRQGTARPVFEPAEERSALRPRLVIGVDCSSSVDHGQLIRFASEVVAIAQKSHAEIHLLCFDEEVFAHRRLHAETVRSAFEDLPLRRDGGTSFVDVLARADGLDPSMIIVLTDLQGPFGAPPRARVLWASPVAMPPKPPFGEVMPLIG